ncbi:MAG: DUF3189 family protein [Acidobacteriota bacterium]
MDIVFTGATGVHQALLAAHIYLGQLNDTDFSYIKGLADLDLDSLGEPIFVGEDSAGNHVYTLGLGQVEIGWKAVNNFLDVAEVSSDRLHMLKVKVPFENVLSYGHIIRKLPMGERLNWIISKWILKRSFSDIIGQVNQLMK